MNATVDPHPLRPVPLTAARVRHHIPGRTRLEAGAVLDAGRADALRQALARRGWTLAGCNAVTRSLLVRHPQTIPPGQVAETVAIILAGAGGPTAGFAGEADPEIGHLMAAPVPAVLEMLGATTRGLDEAEAGRRLSLYGPNALPPPQRRSRATILGGQLTNLPAGLLAGSAVLSLATGGVFDAVVTLGVIALNAAIGFGTEDAVEGLIARLGKPVEHATVVVRGGRARSVMSREVAPGDLIALGPGQAVPADARLIEARDLTVDESILTGESLGVEKTAAPAPTSGARLAERNNMVHAGSVVIGGQGLAVAARTGGRTEAAAVRGLIAAARPPRPLIEEKLDELSRVMAVAAIGASGLVFAIGLMRGRPMVELVRSAVGLAVASLPEGLPAVATTTFALEARAMEKRGILVRMLPAIESIGAIDTLCLDKTGTLTENRMSVAGAAGGSALYAVDAAGALVREDGEPAQEKDRRALAALAEAVALCNTAEPSSEGHENGSGTELALLEFAARVGTDVAAVRAAAPCMAVRERTQTRRFMSTLHAADGETLLFMKGAPEEVLALCRHERRTAGRAPLDAARREEILAQNAALAGMGQRVLGVARRRSRTGAFDPERPDDLEWLGLVGLADPLRPSARAAVAAFQAAGVRTLMITGDQPVTAQAVAEALDLAGGAPVRVVTGGEIAAMDDAALGRAAAEATVFARVTPADKLRIVRALQARGAVVGMLGDGVNDGPALREARVGIAMGRKGSDVAREVADVVIADDDLAALGRAIGRGRSTDDNIRNALRFLLPQNLAEVLVMLVESFGPPQEQETPMELFWLNLVSDVFPAIGLATAEPAGDVMSRPPPDLRGPILGRAERGPLLLDGVQMAMAALIPHFVGHMSGTAPAQVRTATFVSLAGAQLAHAFSLRDRSAGDPAARSLSERRLELSLAGAAGLLVLPFAVPGLGRMLGVGRPHPRLIGVTVASVGGSMLLSELRRGRRAGRITALGASAGPPSG